MRSIAESHPSAFGSSLLGLAFVALATVAGAAPVTATTPLSRRIFDRLSLIYLMDGEMEKSIILQKEAMDRSEAAQNDLIARRGAELVRLLEARGALAEAERWRNEIARHGSAADLDPTPPVVSRPAPTSTAAGQRSCHQEPAPTATSPAQDTAARSARPPAAPTAVATRPEPAAAQGPSDIVTGTTAMNDTPTAMAATAAAAGEEAVGLPTTAVASQRFKRRDSYAKGIAALKRSLAREAAAVPATATASQPPDPAPIAATATSLSPAAGNPDEVPGSSPDRKPVKPLTAPAISASAPATPPAAPSPEPWRAMPRPASPSPPPLSEPARPAAVTPPPDAPRPAPTGIPAPSEAAATSKPATAARPAPAPVPAATPALAERPIVAITPGTGREVVIERPAAKAEPSRAGPVETGRPAAPPVPAAAPPVTSARAPTSADTASAAPRPTTAALQRLTITRPGPASAHTDNPTTPAPRTRQPSPQTIEPEEKPAAGRLRLFPERDTPLPPPPPVSAGRVEPAHPSQPAGSATPVREEVVVERRILGNNRQEIIVERQNQTYRSRQAVTALARTLADTAPAEPATAPGDTGPLLRSTELVKRVVEPTPPGARPGETIYRLQAPSLLPADLPRLPIRTEEEPRQAVVRQTKATSELAAISPIKVTLNFRDVEIADIVRLLATKANLNIISRRQITGRTTVNFEDIPVGTALDTILRHNDYAYELRDGIIWIFPQGDEPSETRVFFVRHVAAADLVEIVRQNLQQLEADHRRSSAMTTMATTATSGQTALDPVTGRPLTGDATANGPGGSTPDSIRTGSSFSGSTGRWHLQVDDRSNSLIVTAPRSKLEEIARLLEVFDRPMESRRLEERIFKVKYIDRATLEKAIKMVLPRFDPEKQMLDVNRVDLRGGGGGSGAGSGSTASTGTR